AASFDGKCKSILFPFIAPPVSPAIASPYPDTHTLDPNGITDGSTATTFAVGFLFKSIHVAVIPEHPVHFAVYLVADIVISLFDFFFCFLSFFCSLLSFFLFLFEFVFDLLVVFFSLFVSVFVFVSACLFVSFVSFVLTSFVFSLFEFLVDVCSILTSFS